MGWLSDHINLIGLIGAIVILLLTIAISYFYINKMKTEKAKGTLGDHEWDGIKEFSNDVPVGWLLSFIVVIIWAIWYILFGYPLNGYSQIGEYNEDRQISNAQFQKKHEGITPDQLQTMGSQLFLLQCSQCHGITAEGIDGKAQDLTKWGKESGIINTIKQGSKGLKQADGQDYMAGEMPPGLISDENDMKAVAKYIITTFVNGKTADANDAVLAKGKEVYATSCASCHGEDGAGQGGMAPNLAHYGKAEMIKDVLLHGKAGNIGQMPSFKYLNFDDVHVKALQTFISKLEPIK